MPDGSMNRLSDGRCFSLLGDGPWIVGRNLDAEICIEDDESCSRLQARISRSGDTFSIAPLSPSNPTSVNGRTIRSSTLLVQGALITFGAQRLIFNYTRSTATAVPSSMTVQVSAMPDGGDLRASLDYLTLDHDITVGREALPGQTVFDHPTISRRHAAFEVQSGRFTVRDLGSTNGTYLNGARLIGSSVLARNDRIDIGPFQLVFDGTGLRNSTRSGNAELEAVDISKELPNRGATGRPLRLLHNITLNIRPRSLVCIIGASGSGKSTLMNILAGRSKATGGSVRLNGLDLHVNFSSLKQDVAFVPQQDVLHEQLTLRQALDYAAQLRLPQDTSPARRRETVEAAARSVDLLERLDIRIDRLSGGQKKRASLASEILNRPSLLFLDEVTSGLDERTDWEIMGLLRRLADEGMTIVAVTHTLANVEEFCHEIVCMGRGGHLTFAGPPVDALSFFEARRLGELFNRMEEGGPSLWREKFNSWAGRTPCEVQSTATAPSAKVPSAREPWTIVKAGIVRQFLILTHRNRRLLLNDNRTLRMAAVQSLLIGALMGYSFSNFGNLTQKTSSQNALLLLLGFLAIWLGCNVASKDIVGELVIYRRERDINLSTAAFVASKYTVSCLFAMLQLTVASLLVTLFAEALPGGFAAQLFPLLIGCAAGTAIGLVISALADSRDQASTIVPLALVPQLVLAGVLVPKLPVLAASFAKIAISGYWLTEALKSVFIKNSGPVLVPDVKTGVPLAMTAQPLILSLFLLLLQAAIFFGCAYAITFSRNGHQR